MPVRVEIIFEGDDIFSVVNDFLGGTWPKVVSMMARPIQPQGITLTSNVTQPAWYVPLTSEEE